MVGGDVHNISVDSDVAMKHELTCSSAGGSDAKAINHVVQTAFEKLEQDFTGDTFGARSLVEEVAENAVFLCFAATVLAVLTRREIPSFEHFVGAKDGFTEFASNFGLGTCISCHES